jgi:hypothetical protein
VPEVLLPDLGEFDCGCWSVAELAEGLAGDEPLCALRPSHRHPVPQAGITNVRLAWRTAAMAHRRRNRFRNR